MLRFTNAQQAAIIANRSNFSAQQRALAATLGAGDFVGNASPLPRDVWGQWDRDSVMIQRDILPVFNDLAASVATPMNIGKLVHYFKTASDSGTVNVSLDGRSKARTDSPVYAYHGTPLPIIDSTFSFGWREVAAAASEGFNLDPVARDNANRRIAEQLETAVLDGYDTITVNGQSSYGLRNHPKRGTRMTGVTLNGATGAEWLAEFTAVLRVLHARNFRVPATIYVNFDDWFYAESTDFKAEGDKTIAQRVRELAGVGNIVAGNSVAENEVIAVVKRRDVLQVLNGMPMTTRAQFRANPEDDYNFATLAAASLEIKFDAEDQCGVAHSAPA